MKLDQHLKRICDNTFYGVAQVDIKVPEGLLEYFAELPSLVKNTTIEKHQLKGHMKDFAEENGLMRKGWRCLVSSYFGEKILLNIGYIKCCLDHGLIVEKNQLVLECQKEKMFADFIDFVSHNRRRG